MDSAALRCTMALAVGQSSSPRNEDSPFHAPTSGVFTAMPCRALTIVNRGECASPFGSASIRDRFTQCLSVRSSRWSFSHSEKI